MGEALRLHDALLADKVGSSLSSVPMSEYCVPSGKCVSYKEKQVNTLAFPEFKSPLLPTIAQVELAWGVPAGAAR